MTPALRVTLDGEALARIDADVVCVGLWENEQPPRGDAGLADWRLCGLLSDLLAAGRARGALGEAVLLPSCGRLRAPRVLVVGLGPRARLDAARARAAAGAGIERAVALGARRLAVGPPSAEPPEGWLAGLLEAAARLASERALDLDLSLHVDPETRASTARAVRGAARGSAFRGISLQLPALADHPDPGRPHAPREPAVPPQGRGRL